ADDASRRRDEPHQRQGGDALPASRFADEAEHAAGLEPERDAVDRASLAPLEEERRPERPHLEQRHQRFSDGTASSGSTREAGGGAKVWDVPTTFSSICSYARRALRPFSVATSTTRGTPSR